MKFYVYPCVVIFLTIDAFAFGQINIVSTQEQVSKQGHVLTWHGNLVDGKNNLTAFFTPKDKKFKEDTASAVSVGTLKWKETEIEQSDKENMVQFTSNGFRPVVKKLYPSFFSGEFKQSKGEDGPSELDLWSAFGGINLGNVATGHQYYNMHQEDNKADDAYKIVVSGYVGHNISNKKVETNIDDLE